MENLLDMLVREIGKKVETDVPLSRYTTLKIGGKCDYFVEVTSRDEMTSAVMAAIKAGIPYFILGGGSNLLISDDGIAGLVIHNHMKNITVKGIRGMIKRGVSTRQVFVECDSGVPMNHLVRFTLEQGLAGLEMHLGLPGSVGGAVFMNSKWTHPTGYVGDVLYQGVILTHEGTVSTVPKSYFRFAYDYSVLHKTRETLLSVVFGLRQENKDTLWKIANDSISYRRQSQPQGVFTAGCIFRNISQADALSHAVPDGVTSAGFFIDHSGCKGMRVGDAEVSGQHANFIINRGQAKAGDVVELIDKIRTEVRNHFGLTLKEEIIRVGRFEK